MRCDALWLWLWLWLWLCSLLRPHNMYLHSALVQSRAINRRLPSKVSEANFYFSLEALVALAVSFSINFAVVCVFARGFFNEECAQQGMGLLDGQCSDDIGLSTAGDALRGLLGGAAQTVWAVGLLASGQSSTMTGVTAGQYVTNGFLQLRLKPWQRLMLTRSIALVPSVAVALSSLGQTTTLDATNQAVNVVQSVLIPFAILPLLHFTSDKRLMGAFVNTGWMMALGWTFAALVIAINVYLVASTLSDAAVSSGVWVAFCFGTLLYLALIVLLVREELQRSWLWTMRLPARVKDAGGWRAALRGAAGGARARGGGGSADVLGGVGRDAGSLHARSAAAQWPDLPVVAGVTRGREGGRRSGDGPAPSGSVRHRAGRRHCRHLVQASHPISVHAPTLTAHC